MAQPPTQPTQSRQLVRSVPFITPRTFLGALAAPGSSVSAEFDTIGGFADPNLFNNVLAYPGTNVPKIHAVGPFLDAAVFADGITLLRVEYSVDRGCAYHAVAPDTTVPANTFINISGLRITGRFVKVSLINGANAGVVNVEFGVYVRSA